MSSSFCSKAEQPPKLMDEEEKAHRLEERQKRFREYREARQAVLLERDRDRELRNEAKTEQLETAEEWQVRYNTPGRDGETQETIWSPKISDMHRTLVDLIVPAVV